MVMVVAVMVREGKRQIRGEGLRDRKEGEIVEEDGGLAALLERSERS